MAMNTGLSQVFQKWPRAAESLAPSDPQVASSTPEDDQAEQERRRHRGELAHAARLETIQEAVCSIAHELNQPLAAVVLQAEITAKKMRLGKEGGKQDVINALDHIADDAYRAGQIIQRMKDFVKKFEPRRNSVDLDGIIREVLTLVEDELRHAGIACTIELDQSPAMIRADAIQVQQVLLNLIRNAAEAIGRAEPGDHQITLRGRTRNGAREISVGDTGCGITDDRTFQCFETFYTTKPGGMGLGLAISRSIVESHGGHIEATQNPDRGATFTFTMPIAPEDKNHAS